MMTADYKLPQGWTSTTLGRLKAERKTSLNPSDSPERVFELYSVPSHPSGRPEFVTGREIGSTKQVVSPGDVLLCKINPRINRAWVIGEQSDKPQIASTEWFVFPANSGIDPKYLRHFLTTDRVRDHLASNVSGVGGSLMRARPAALEDIGFPLAPLPEQRRIVAKIEELFSRLDAGVAALKRVQAALKRYKASVLKAACEGRLVPQDPSDEPADALLARILAERGSDAKKSKRAGRLWGSGAVSDLTIEQKSRVPASWIWAKVRDLGADPDDTVQVGPMSMRSQDFEDDGIPVLNVGCVQWGFIDEAKLNHLPQRLVRAFERYRLQDGDVMFTRSGTVGRSAVIRDKQTGWLMTFHLLRARPDPHLCLPDYLQVVFEGASHIRKQTRDASIGTTRAGFNTNLLADLDVPLPPLAEQKRIMAEVERRSSVVSSLNAAIESDLIRAARLRQSILAAAFAGRLAPQLEIDEPAGRLLEQLHAGDRGDQESTRKLGRRKGQSTTQMSLSDR